MITKSLTRYPWKDLSELLIHKYLKCFSFDNSENQNNTIYELFVNCECCIVNYRVIHIVYTTKGLQPHESCTFVRRATTPRDENCCVCTITVRILLVLLVNALIIALYHQYLIGSAVNHYHRIGCICK